MPPKQDNITNRLHYLCTKSVTMHYRLYIAPIINYIWNVGVLPWFLISARSRRGASWWTSLSALSSPAGCVPWLVSWRKMCRSTPRCCQSTPSSTSPFFACLRLFREVSLRLGRMIFSCIPTPFSVFVALHLLGVPRKIL